MAFGDFTVVRSTVKNVLGSNGLLQEVAINTPAFEFNADGSYKGLLVEPAGTNIALRSEEFDDAAWNKSLVTITANYDTAPNNTATADRWVSAGGSFPQIAQTITVVSSTVYTASLYVKSDGTAQIEQRVIIGGSGVNFTPTNNWQRVSVTFTASSASVAFVIATNSPTAPVSSFVIWGAQVETGAVATSYIPTVASTVTRTADEVTLSSASSLIGQTEGTLYVEVDWRATTETQCLLAISDNTLNNRIQISKVPAEFVMFTRSNGVNQTFQGQSFAGYTGIIKAAFAYKQNDAVLFKDGVLISADSVYDLSALGTLTTVSIGSLNSTIEHVNMWIRSVALFPTRLSNTQLAALTTL